MTDMAIYFDMDGTLANLYAVEDWLEKLRAFDPAPYRHAAVMYRMNQLARQLNQLQSQGAEIYIVSWLSKVSTPDYDVAVIEAKKSWLKEHLRSVQWDNMFFLPYGTPKSSVMGNSTVSLLFDDELQNRQEWRENGGIACLPDDFNSVLRNL